MVGVATGTEFTSRADEVDGVLTAKQLRTLLEFGRSVNVQLELQRLLEMVPRLAAEVTRSGGAALLLINPASGGLRHTTTSGLGREFLLDWRAAVDHREPGEGSEIGLVRGASEPVVVADLFAATRPHRTRLAAIGAGMRSLVAAPLNTRSGFAGVLVAYRATADGFSEQDAAFVGAMAEQAAVAVENARLHSQTQRELRRREAVRSVVATISSELELSALLAQVARSTVELLDATGSSISLVEPNGVARVLAVYNLPAELVGQRIGRGYALSGQVLETRAPVVVNEYADLPHPMPGLEQFHAGIAVPIWRHSEMTGVFVVFSAQPGRTFDAEDLDTMELLADHVAIALENARLYGELQQRVDEIVSIQRFATVLLEEHDFDRVLEAVCEPLLRLTDATGVGISLLTEDGKHLELRTVVGPSAGRLLGARIPLEGSLGGTALRTGEPQRSDDAQNDPRGHRPSLVLGETRTILSVPLKTRQRDVGTLSIYNKRGGSGFTERDAELATLFASHAAVAIENARLYETTREYAVVEERNRLARELHDSVTQSIFSVTLLVQAGLSLWERDPAKGRERLERANELAQGALAEMRALIFQLRPIALQEEGLVSALKKHVVALRNREKLAIQFVVDGQERRVPASVEEAAFRIAQESLNNVAKHARAEKVVVRLQFGDRTLRVCTEDDGVGFNPGGRTRTRTLGMTSMRERAEAAGGRIEVHSQPARGTRIVAELPIPPAPKENPS